MSARIAAKRAVGALIGRDRADLLSISVQDEWGRLGYGVRSCGRKSKARLEALHDTQTGRCFVIGNGPSLNAQDLSLLRNEATFALNRGYLLADRIGAPPTYLVAVNHYVLEQFCGDILETPTTKFVSWAARKNVPCRDDLVFVRRRLRPGFARELHREGAWEGATVTFLALQLAHHIGFTEVVLIGVDHSFSTKGTPNQLVTSTGADPNHFDPSYFGAGIRWQLPDLETSEVAYVMARDAYASDGRRILNATAGGALEIFPRVDLRAHVQSAVPERA